MLFELLSAALYFATGFAFCFFIAAGSATLLRAGRVEATGQREAAGKLCYRGGLMLAFSAFPAGVLISAGFFLVGIVTGEAWKWPSLAGALLATSGIAALLAGLTRKPRPTGWVALGLLALATLIALPMLWNVLIHLSRLASELD